MFVFHLGRLTMAALAVLLASTVTVAASVSPEVQKRIEAVENGLMPDVRIKGRPAKGNIGQRMQRLLVPGASVAVIDNYQLEWAKGYGVLDASSMAPVTTETLFQAASISKPISALAALRLVQDGVLDLDRNINEQLKSWKLPSNGHTEKHPVDLRSILSHRAGLTVHGFPGYAVGAALPSVIEILDGKSPANTAAVRVDKLPGESFRYSGGGTTVMQQLLFDVTGRPFAEFMRSTVLEPLGMTASRFDQPPGEEVVRLAATAHDARGRVVEGRWRVHPEQAAAGLWTNPSELARYVVEIQLAHEGKSAKVLTRETVDAMLTRQGDGAAGLGPFIHESGGVKRFSHGGQNLGFSCLFVGLLDRGQGAVVMTNSDIGGRLVAEIMNAVAVEYGWPDYLPPERDVVVLDAERLDRYVGRYVFSAASSATIKREGDRLVASVSDGPDLELYFENETTFFTDQARVGGTFVVDGDGRASEIRLDIAGEKHSAKRADD